jgi:hypothetical protein
MTTAHGSRKSHVYYLLKNKFLGGLSLRHLRKLSPKKLHHRSPGKTFPWPPVEEPTLDCRPIQSPPPEFYVHCTHSIDHESPRDDRGTSLSVCHPRPSPFTTEFLGVWPASAYPVRGSLFRVLATGSSSPNDYVFAGRNRINYTQGAYHKQLTSLQRS